MSLKAAGGLPTSVHPGLGFCNRKGVSPPAPFPRNRIRSGMRAQGDPAALCDPVNHFVTDVMACSLVFRAWIPQPKDYALFLWH